LFPAKRDQIKCDDCGYTIVKPYPKDQLCPKCKKFLANIFEYSANDNNSVKAPPKQFETKKSTASSKLKGKVRIKKREQDFSLKDEKILLKGEKEYVKFFGITSIERTPLFSSNQKYRYLLELTNNLDYIATGILDGELDKMLLISEKGEEEKCQFFVKGELIYIVYGVFPDKKGEWILMQMKKYYSELVKGKDVDNLSNLEEYDIKKQFKGQLRFILKEYLQLQEVITDQEIPYTKDWIRIDYIGLSSMSIGVISLLLDDLGILKLEVPGEYENEAEELEMKESLLTAKIEAIAANTLGNTGAYPRWIAVKLPIGYGGLGLGGQYRFLTFKKYQNNYFLSCLSEGNLKKVENFEQKLEPILYYGIDTPFTGNLRPFNKLKATIKDLVKKIPERKII